MDGLTWLHLSDWHQNRPDFDRSVVLQELLTDLKKRVDWDPGLAKLDFVIFSGDVAWQGKEAEFQAARKEFFEPVLAAVGLTASDLFVVPGNHDLDLGWIAEFAPDELKRPMADEAMVQKWLEAGRQRRDRVLEPFEGFSQFVSSFTGQSTPAFANTRTFFVGKVRVGVLCLNSAWMCGRNRNQQGKIHDYGYLTIGEPQVRAALEEIAAADVRLAVVHHPFSWLQEFDRLRVGGLLKQQCHFILHGHEHRPGIEINRLPGGECAIIPAGAGFSGRTREDPAYSNAYNFVRLDFARGEGVIHLRLHGNVWEWCEDWLGSYAAAAVVDPTGPPKGELRVLRGGSWIDPGENCRSAYRNGNDPANRNSRIGFRLVLAPSSLRRQ